MIILEKFKSSKVDFLNEMRGGKDWKIVGTSTYADGTTSADIQYNDGQTICDIHDDNLSWF